MMKAFLGWSFGSEMSSTLVDISIDELAMKKELYHSVHFHLKSKLLRWWANQSVNLPVSSMSIQSMCLNRNRIALPRVGAIAAGANLQLSVITE